MCLQTNILGSSSYERQETADFGFAFILWQTAIENLMASILSAIHCIYEYRRITSSHQLLQFDGVRTLDFFTSQSGQLSLKITSQISKLLAFGQFSTFLAIPGCAQLQLSYVLSLQDGRLNFTRKMYQLISGFPLEPTVSCSSKKYQ